MEIIEHTEFLPDGGAGKALPPFGGAEPGPVEFVVEGLVLDKQLNSLFGDGGLGKSYLALHLAFCVASGRPFFGRKVRRRTVLYIDVENLGHEETLRRAYQVGRGYGLESPEGGVYYYAPEKPLGSAETHAEVEGIIGGLGVGFIVLDSLTLGAVGTNASDQVEVVKLLWDILKWGVPVLTLDHISKSARSDQANASAFGSVMKRNAARSMMRLHRSPDDGPLVLTHDKINCGPLSDPVYYDMSFEDDSGRVSVGFREADESEVRKASSTGRPHYRLNLPLSEFYVPEPTDKERVWMHVTLHYHATGRAADAGTIAQGTGIEQPSVTTHLSALYKASKVRRADRGFYLPREDVAKYPILGSNPYRVGVGG